MHSLSTFDTNSNDGARMRSYFYFTDSNVKYTGYCWPDTEDIKMVLEKFGDQRLFYSTWSLVGVRI